MCDERFVTLSPSSFWLAAWRTACRKGRGAERCGKLPHGISLSHGDITERETKRLLTAAISNPSETAFPQYPGPLWKRASPQLGVIIIHVSPSSFHRDEEASDVDNDQIHKRWEPSISCPDFLHLLNLYQYMVGWLCTCGDLKQHPFNSPPSSL